MGKRLKILVSAYACSPYQGSEPAVGWGFVSELSKRHDLWVLVEEEKFRCDIERYLREHPEFPRTTKFYFIKKRRARFLRRVYPPSYYWFYRRWHLRAYALAKELHEHVRFDLAHQLTMVGFREPGYLWKLELPFVWGPVGGMGVFPWNFLGSVGPGAALYYIAYNAINYVQMRLASRPRTAAMLAGTGLISATPENQKSAQMYWRCSGPVLTEVGLPSPPKETSQIVGRVSGEPVRFVWTGLHIARKALPLALRALAALPPDISWELHILGAGPLSKYWNRVAHALGVAGRCVFHGWLPREDALQLMASAHVMLITSLRDLTSTVTVEALSLGLPVIALDHCGFSHVIDGTCGIRVPLHSREQVIRDLSNAAATLARDEAHRFRLANGAIRRAEEFRWSTKVDKLERIYEQRLEIYEQGS